MQEKIESLIDSPWAKVFVSGPPGTGKTALAVERLRWLTRRGVPATAILVLVPQRTLATAYYDALRDVELGPTGRVDVITLDGLARRIIRLFWPLIGDRAGFAQPTQAPIFLTVETAQYFMDGIVGPLIDEYGYFDAVTIERTRLLSQLLDNLNKAALIGLPLSDVAERLKSAWTGESTQGRVFDQAGECVERFRRYCLDHNLLDFSLQLETFLRYLWPQPSVRAYLFERYRHLLVDNVEEDTPVVHDMLTEWVKQSDSALIAFDQDGGYRIFLGADPVSASRLAAACGETVELTQSHVAPPDVLDLGYQVGRSLQIEFKPEQIYSSVEDSDFRRILHFEERRFHPQMLEWASDEIVGLVKEGTPPGEIVVLAPFISDALRFSLVENLSTHGVPTYSHRPSRALRDEPATRCLMTLAKLAHPEWGLLPPAFDVTLALTQAIDGMDLVRARLLTDIVYRPQGSIFELGAFAHIQDETRNRIGYLGGERYDALREWLEHYRAEAAERPVAEGEVHLDHVLSRLFGEVLSQPGFGFHSTIQPTSESGGPALESGRVASDLIESARKFRVALERVPNSDGQAGNSIGARFVRMVERGVVAATYVQSWRLTQENAVLVAPAYTYLMTNRIADYQFWLDAGSNGWWERIYQPLTHPYVLRRDWEPGRSWTDEDEFRVRQESLFRLVLGLVRRCRKAIFLGVSELSEQGYEQRGPLLQAIQSALRRATD